MHDKMRTETREIMRRSIILQEGGFAISDIIHVLQILHSKKSNKNIEIIVKNSIEIMKSLTIAINQAEGNEWLTSELCKMTAFDLILTLASNQIQFVFTGKNKKD